MRYIMVPLIVCAALAASADTASAEPPWDGYVESTLYPIRVHYTNSATLAKAEQALGFAEASWQIQVEQMGFAPPVTEDATGNRVDGLWIFLDPNGQYDHAEPIADNPDTAYTDCTMRVVITSLTPVSYFETVVYHEMNHALEMTADCGEAGYAFENTTMAVQAIIFPGDQLFGEYMLPVFQANPHHGVDCTFFMDQNKRYYHYGAGLFQVFLDDRYGNYDGALLPQIWEAAKQDGTVTVGGYGVTMNVPNEPHLMDAIEAVLAGPTFDEAFVEFARWRYFLGTRDDGEHFTDGSLYGAAPLHIEEEWVLSDLPLVAQIPTNLPNEYGTVYLETDLDGLDAEHGLRFAIQADPTLTWNVDVLLFNADGTADLQTVTLESDNTGEVTLEGVEGYDRALFVVSNLGDGDHSPDYPDCNAGATFAYDLEVVATAVPPEITSVDPSELLIGETHQVWVYGTGFAEAANVATNSGDVLVSAVTYVDETTLSVDLTVSADAAEGTVSLTVTNPNGMQDTAADALTLVLPEEVDEPKDGGCGCRSATDGEAGGLLLGLLLLGLVLRRRKRG